MNDSIEILEGTGHWRTRDVKYLAGRWSTLRSVLPTFQMEDFKSEGDAPSNPYLKTIVRLPTTKFERPIPVGVVSPKYTLAQHAEVAEKCLEGIRRCEIETEYLKCEVGLTELGEWMNLRIYFPDDYVHTPRRDNEKLALRLECFNSVEGSSRLTLFFGWLRFVCSNGLVIGDTKAELRDTHDKNLDLDQIPDIIEGGMQLVDADLERLNDWDSTDFDTNHLATWINKYVADKWGKKAAARVYHLCTSGCDVHFPLPFAPGNATEKPVELGVEVAGAANPAKSLYDVGQALSWVATNRRNPEERVTWQIQIPTLVRSLRKQIKNR